MSFHIPDFGRVVGFQYKLPSKSYAVFHLPAQPTETAPAVTPTSQSQSIPQPHPNFHSINPVTTHYNDYHPHGVTVDPNSYSINPVTTDYSGHYSPYQPTSLPPYPRRPPTTFSPVTAIFRD